MKHVFLIIMYSILVTTIMGCEKVDQAFEAVDKVKSIKADFEKKGNEVKEKAQNLVPESVREMLNEKKESKDKKEKKKDE